MNVSISLDVDDLAAIHLTNNALRNGPDYRGRWQTTMRSTPFEQGKPDAYLTSADCRRLANVFDRLAYDIDRADNARKTEAAK